MDTAANNLKSDLAPLPSQRYVGAGNAMRTARATARPLSSWQLERSSRLQKICLAIERARASGKTLRRALRCPVRNARKAVYKSGKKIRLSRGRLIQIYYAWRRAGKTPLAFRLNYYKHPSGVSARLLAAFIRACARPGISSQMAAYLSLRAKLSYHSFNRALPDATRREIRRLHQARFAARAAEKRFARLCPSATT